LALVIDVPRGSPDRPGDFRSYGHRECRAMIRKLKKINGSLGRARTADLVINSNRATVLKQHW
jgi:hypothetical protein